MFALLMVLHYVADFLLQPREMGKKKSSEPKWLAGHLLIQFLCFLPFTGWKFALANCVVHGVIDWNIWRGYKLLAAYRIMNKVDPLGLIRKQYTVEEAMKEHPAVKEEVLNWKFYEDHWFYATIGLDQLLHMLTLYFLHKALL